MKAIKKSMKGNSQEEVNQILAQFSDERHKMQSKLEDRRQKERDALLAKLAARKRMKEELEKEKAVAEELDRITKALVMINHCSVMFKVNHNSNINHALQH
jgi:cell division septum initiation protein DivIVA